MRIERIEHDAADKWRVLVSLSETEAQFFKFQAYPSESQILAEAEKFIQAKQDMENADSTEI